MISVYWWSTTVTAPKMIKSLTSCSIRPAATRSSYVMGYGNKKKWQKALGGQYGCLYIDEINTADIDFVREAAMRCDYLMATLNPDDPTLGCVQGVYQLQQAASRMGGGDTAGN